MRPTRREVLLGCAAGAALLPSPLGGEGPGVRGAEAPRRPRMGIVIHSYCLRRADPKSHFDDPLTFLKYCRALGAGGAQTAVGVRDRDEATRLRAWLEETGMYLEGIVRLPRDREDVARFDAEIKSAKDCGAGVLRTVALSGRRYETFRTAEAFRRFAAAAWESLRLAEPVVRRHQVRLAVENHKDWRVDDLLPMLKRLDSPHVGVCVDTGNSIALLEEPHEVVRAYAPWAFSTHFKDMGVREFADGFLLSEVPLGTGFLDLPAVVEALRKARPEVRFNLEMITRDPLRVPCLAPDYWATFEALPGRHLASSLRMVRKHAAKGPLPAVAHLGREEKHRVEDDNVRQSLKYARDRLGL